MRGKTRPQKSWIPTKELILERRALELAEIMRGDAEDYFGGRLLMLRMSLGLSPEQISPRCGLDKSSWRNWEGGMVPRNLPEVVQKIVAATGVNRDWMLWGPDTEAESRARSRCSAPHLREMPPAVAV